MISLGTKLTIAATVVAVIAVEGDAMGQGNDVDADSMKLQIEQILEQQHWFYRPSPQKLEAFEELKRAFNEEHLALVKEAMDLPDEDWELLKTAQAQLYSMRHARAIGLLGMISGDLARAALVEHYRRLTSRLRSVEQAHGVREHRNRNPTRTVRVLLSFRRSTLVEVGGVGAVELVDEVMTEIQVADGATRVVMLSYLEKVAPLRPDIRPKLEETYKSPDSPLRNHPQLLRVLEAMDKAAAEQKKEGDKDKSRDRKREDE